MSKKKDLTFAEARARLDDILAEVENEGGDVDQLAARVREAAELIRFCRDRLSAARAQVTQVVAELSAVEQSVAQDGTSGDADAVEREDDEDDDAEVGGFESDASGGEASGRGGRGGKLPF